MMWFIITLVKVRFMMHDQIEYYQCNDCSKKFMILRGSIGSYYIKSDSVISAFDTRMKNPEKVLFGLVLPCEHCKSNNVEKYKTNKAMI